MSKARVLAIVGPTASGKTGLALDVAKIIQSEIICADSRTIYKGMDIGTAKPSLEEQLQVPHHCLDLLLPSESYSAAEFKRKAQTLAKEIADRGKLPIVAGGTGLYAYALMYNYDFPAGADNELRKELEGYETSKLAAMLKELDEETYSKIDTQNPRRLIRAIETVGKPKSKSKLPEDYIIVGLNPPMDILEDRIKSRTKAMIKDGLVDEVKNLKSRYGESIEALQSVGYKEILDYLSGKNTLEEAIELINLHTRQLAKRQMTWFKRNADIKWFDDHNLAKDYIMKTLM